MKGTVAEAARKSREYEWFEAAALYQKAVRELGPQGDPLEMGRLTEMAAKSYFNASFQAVNREEFKRKMRLAEEEYQKAQTLYERTGSEPLLKRTKARQLFAVFWLKEDLDLEEGKKIIAESISLASEASNVFEAQRDRRGLAEAQKDLLYYLSLGMDLAKEWTVLKEQFDTVVGITDSVVNGFEALGDDEGLLESLYMIVYVLPSYFDYVYGPTEVGEIAERTVELSGKLRTVAERIGTPDALCMANISVFCATANLETDQSKLRKLAETAVSAAEKTRDLRWIRRSLFMLIWWMRLQAEVEEDPEQRRLLWEKCASTLSTMIETRRITAPFSLAWDYDRLAGCYLESAALVEAEPEKRREYLKRAVETARTGMNYGIAFPVLEQAGTLSRALYHQATIEPNFQQKRRLLEEALTLSEAYVRNIDVSVNPLCISRGFSRNFQALIKAELAKMSQDPKTKKEILEGAVEDLRICVDLCAQWAQSPAKISGSVHHRYYESYGDILLQLHTLTHEPKTAQQAIKAYDDAIADLTRLELVASTAPLRWKVARVYDSLGDYGQAQDAFERAAESYRAGAKKVPGSAQTFEELASYMDAWSMIEEAQLNHDEEQYAAAAENYEKAAKTLEKTKAWNSLSGHYKACSLLEKGEAASRLEKTDISTEAFLGAAKAFQQTRTALEDRLHGSSGLEKEELQGWVVITKNREQYCRGRIELEEAKTLDIQGDEAGSARRYRSAAKAFKALLTEAQVEQSRRELETLGLFCEAWGKMKEAEASALPELYAEAADLFRRAEGISTRERYRLLALANASICKALESGTLFRRTRNTELYAEIKIRLETATDYYQKAGLQHAADWAQATGNLFDALVYLADAASERESKKRTELYHLAEKHLELAAKLYDEAGFGGKKDEALKHLKRVREEKGILLTPIEALTESPAASSISVAPVSMVRNQAPGLERFDVANVVGNLSISQKDVSVGSDLTVDLELANVGKTAATLIKLQNVATDGLEVDRQKIAQRVEDNYIDLKGKRLEYLKTHEVKIPLKAIRKGGFEVKPKILYVDEQGNYRSFEFGPAVITVSELGISGWLKGPK